MSATRYPDSLTSPASSLAGTANRRPAAEAGGTPFARLDDIVCDPDAHGVVELTAPEPTLDAVVRHIERRAAQVGRAAAAAGTTPSSEPYRQLARAAGVALRSAGRSAGRSDGQSDGQSDGRSDGGQGDPIALAVRLASACRGRVLVVVERHGGSAWGGHVFAELAAQAADPERRLLLVRLVPAQRGPAAGAAHDRVSRALARGASIVVEELTRDDQLRWWDAVIAADGFMDAPGFGRLGQLDGWWRAVRRQGLTRSGGFLPGGWGAAPLVRRQGLGPGELGAGDVDAVAGLAGLDAGARALVTALLLADEPLDSGEVERIASQAAADQLVRAGYASGDASGGLVLTDEGAELAARLAMVQTDLADSLAVAELLAERADADAWTCLRTAELFCEAGEIERARLVAFDGLTRVADGSARDDLWRRWQRCLERVRQQHAAGAEAGGAEAVRANREHVDRLLCSAERALELGDSDRADAMARDALGFDTERFDTLLVQGKACSARGDLTTASLALMRAMFVAVGDAARARAEAVMAEVRLLSGDQGDARRYAERATAGAEDLATRLAARNVLGKLLLSAEAWSDAEKHFAADAYDAAAAGQTEAELRAKLNRGIAVFSSGRRDEARRMYSEVLAEGERRGNQRAVAYALSNLAAIAMLDHRYAEALDLSDQAIEVRRQVGERLGLVLPIANLAQLRLRLGLYEEAEQALRFGLQSCGHSLPLSRHGYFAKAAALIHLERGQLQAAARQVDVMRQGASSAGDPSQLSQCERLAARVCLEQGDVPGARQALAAARRYQHSTKGRAELALLEALLRQAEGEPFVVAAEAALELAQRIDDSERTREAYVVLHHACRVDGDKVGAAAALRGAERQRDQVAGGLPEALRERYLARRPIVVLAELARLLRQRDIDRQPPPRAGGDGSPATVRSAVHGPAPSGDSATARDQPKLVGESAAMRLLRGTIRRVAALDATVLIHGPTGTGKELVAESIHALSPRVRGPLVKVNCAALVETLLLSELFGHEKGAFTGASSRRRGRFELAEGGTLFLDEIGDISPRTQVALLRVLQDGTFERVGGCTGLRANVRVVCATHRDLRAMVDRGEFREDLYYRLCGVVVEVPALRERICDLPSLCEALLERAGRETSIERRPLASEALSGLARHDWPGNVRELENALRVAALFARGASIDLADFTTNIEGLRYLAEPPRGVDRPVYGAGGSGAGGFGSGGFGSARRGSLPPPARGEAEPALCVPDLGVPELGLPAPASNAGDVVYAEVRAGVGLAEMKKALEKECITRALIEVGGNITRAATMLGMKRPRLSQLVKQYDLSAVLEDMKP